MRKSILLVAGLVVLLSPVFLALAADAPTGKPQTKCPVMGNDIDKSVFVDQDGQRVYFCCAKCAEPFKKDPDKFFAKMAAEGVVPENIQKTCPVSGETLESKTTFTDYKGRRIYFCCNKCKGAFEKDPGKYLAKMNEPSKPKS
jgi:YHS domain-containing protein